MLFKAHFELSFKAIIYEAEMTKAIVAFTGVVIRGNESVNINSAVCNSLMLFLLKPTHFSSAARTYENILKLY